MKVIRPENEFNSKGNDFLPAGDYVVTGFDWWSGGKFRDDFDRPILVPQKNGLVGRLNFKLENGKQGPAMSVALSEMPLLVAAFGGELSALPPIPTPNRPDDVSEYMTRTQALAAGETRIRTKGVNNWLNLSDVKGAEVPKGYYHFYISEINPLDANGKPVVAVGTNGKYYRIIFTILGGKGGVVNNFSGCTVTEMIRYPIVVTNGEADWKKNDSGNLAQESSITNMLIRLTAPSCYADFTPPNFEDILSWWWNEAGSRKQVLKGGRHTSNKATKINKVRWTWGDFDKSDFDISHFQPEAIEGKDYLVQLLEYLAGKSVVDEGTYDLNIEGISVARKYITPLKQSGEVTHGQIDQLTFEEIEAIFENVQSQVDDDKIKSIRSNFQGSGLGLEPEEDLDTPF